MLHFELEYIPLLIVIIIILLIVFGHGQLRLRLLVSLQRCSACRIFVVTALSYFVTINTMDVPVVVFIVDETTFSY